MKQLILILIGLFFSIDASCQCFTEVQKYDSSYLEIYFTRRYKLIKTVTIKSNESHLDTVIRYYDAYVNESKLKITTWGNSVEDYSCYELFCPGVNIAEFYPILKKLDKSFGLFTLADTSKIIKKKELIPGTNQYYTNIYEFGATHVDGLIVSVFFKVTGINVSGYTYIIEQTNKDTLFIKIWNWGS